MTTTTPQSVEEYVTLFRKEYRTRESGLRCSECNSKYRGTRGLRQQCPECKLRSMLTAHGEAMREEGRREQRETLKKEFISEFCNNHGELRWLRGVAYDMPGLLESIMEFFNQK